MAEMPKMQEHFSAACGTFCRQREKGKMFHRTGRTVRFGRCYR